VLRISKNVFTVFSGRQKEVAMRPHTSYLICATQRSGSTLLCEALQNTGLAGWPEEYFQTHKKSGSIRPPEDYFKGLNVTEMMSYLNDSSPPSLPLPQEDGQPYENFLNEVLKRGTTPNGVFGAKIMWAYFGGFISKLREIPRYRKVKGNNLLSTVFPNLHYIWLTRQDKVRQAVSLWKALQTWVWRQDDDTFPPSREPQFHFTAIDHLVHQIEADELAWRRYFRRQRIQPYIVVYEQLVSAYEETALDILRYLDIPLSRRPTFSERRMRRQADALSEEWVQRYHRYKQTA
jgi:LPS sulfotransferase NodH